MEAAPDDMWSPYKIFGSTFHSALTSPPESIANMEQCLKKHKQFFTNLLRNPPKNEKHRALLRNSLSDGVIVNAVGRKAPLSKDLIDEALIISDMFDMDELIAMELLNSALRQLANHPGLPRGLIAVLLYYDGRRDMACVVRDLFEAVAGVTWASNCSREITMLVSSYAQNLVEDSNILARIIDLLDEHLDKTKENAMLTKNRAFGSIKHQNQIMDIFDEIRMALALAVFNWSAQRGLPRQIALRLIDYLSKHQTSEASGVIDDVALTLLMALVCSYDTSVLQRQEDSNPYVQNLPILCDADFAEQIYEKLNAMQREEDNFRNNRLISFIKFTFGLTLASLRHAPANLQIAVNRIIERDEQLIDEAIAGGVFDFMLHNLLEKESIYKLEYFYRRMHMVFTDFIDFMHSKVTELRGRAEETWRTISTCKAEGIEIPYNLDNNFELLMLCIAKLYKDNPGGLSLCIEYWGPTDAIGEETYITTTRAVSLFKFVRLAGELLPSTLFVAYLSMITGLTSCEHSARNAYNLLKQAQPQALHHSIVLSWDHFFISMKKHYNDLRQESSILSSDSIYGNRSFAFRGINPIEVEGMQAVLRIIAAVATHDEVSRIILCQHQTWTPIQMFIGLLGCAIPLSFKANLLLTLAALAKSVETSVTIWNYLEDSQVIQTITLANSQCSLEEEIDQNECRAETYELSRAVLDLLLTLVETNVPSNLGSGIRKPGLEPYLKFVVNTIFLKFYRRTYKNPIEKWQVGSKCLRFIYFLLEKYVPQPQDFVEKRDQITHPGYYIMLHLHTKSDMLNLILLLIEDIRIQLDEYSKFRGKEHVEECALYCLLILENALAKQSLFFESHSIANSALLLGGLNRMLLDINPRTRQPDFLLNLTKFVTYNSWLPKHTLTAVKILNVVTNLPNTSNHILDMYGQADMAKFEIRKGFVECLEADVPPLTDFENVDEFTSKDENCRIELQIKEAIIKFFQRCIKHPFPNFAYFLLGFDGNKEYLSGVNMRQAQMSVDTGMTCMKSLVYLLERNLVLQRNCDYYDEQAEHIIALVWQLLYSLYENRRTKETTMRFVRVACNDFLLRQLAALPYKNASEAHVIDQMSYVLKSVAIELKISAYNGQISRFATISEILLGTGGDNTQQQSNVPIEYSNLFAQNSRLYDDTNMTVKPTDPGTRLHLCRLLEYITLNSNEIYLPRLEFYDNSLIGQVIIDCEMKSSGHRAYALINIKKLHELLHDELSTVQGTVVSGQRQQMLLEIKIILRYAIQLNYKRNLRLATVRFMNSWTTVTETLYTCMPDTALPLNVRKQHLVDIIERLLSKVQIVDRLLDIALLGTGTLQLLLSHLRLCYYELEDGATLESEHNNTANTITSQETENANNNGLLTSNTATSIHVHLRFILKNIIEWIMVTDVNSQTLRLNLYTSLLHCMRIVKRYRTDDEIETGETYVSLLDQSVNIDAVHFTDVNQVRMAIEVISSFGEQLITVICEDVVSGHDICRMGAMACLNILLELDTMPMIMNTLSMRGYLTTIVGGLLASDEELCLTLRENPDCMKAIYKYESKMGLIVRLCRSYVGAEMLLGENILAKLADMKVFDMQPDLKSNILQRNENNGESFLPGVAQRYRSILFPALHVCDSLLTTFGPDNASVAAQVLNFIFVHSDTFESMLRSGTPFMDIGFLEELSGITNLIARTATRSIYGVCLDNERAANNVAKKNYMNDVNGNDAKQYDKDQRNNLNRIQQLMMTLFGRFVMNETTLWNMFKPENVAYELTETNKAQHMRYFLEISSNLSIYCRNIITSHKSTNKTKLLLTTLMNDGSGLGPEGNYSKRLTSILQNIVLAQLKGAVNYYLEQKSYADNLLKQRSSLPNISFDPNAKKRHLELTQRYNSKQSDLKLAVYIVEHCLYLLWLHLDYYMSRTVIFNMDNRNSMNDAAHQENLSFSLTASFDEIEALKKTLLSTFNETFCIQIISTAKGGTAYKNFCEECLNGIKRLIQVTPMSY